MIIRRERARSGDRRQDVLAALRSAGAALTVVQIADRLGIHPNTVRFHLDKLVESGRVERLRTEPGRPGRPAFRFRMAPGMDTTGPRRYRLLAELLLAEVAHGRHPRARAEAAGRSWGAALGGPGDARTDDPLDRLASVLADLGFAPEPPEGTAPATIGLRHCPFLELVPVGPGLVCQVHLGLMRGALQAWSSAVTVDRLQPFAGPDRCVAHLAAA
jgi:predicted ArsR family transcriptional regulator